MIALHFRVSAATATVRQTPGWLVLFALMLAARVAVAQTTTKDAPPDFLEDARKYVIQTAQDRVRLELNEKSVLNWTNPVRQQERGATYVWLHKHRPYVIATLFSYGAGDKAHVKHEFHSLAPLPLQATFDGVPAWTPVNPVLFGKISLKHQFRLRRASLDCCRCGNSPATSGRN